MSHHLHTADQDRPKQVRGPGGLLGYRNVRCAKCGMNMPFFVGNLKNAWCRDCDCLMRFTNTAGNLNPPTPPEIRRYHG